jgi:hypothetical protein
MKKIVATTFCILMLSSLIMLLTVGTVMAAEPGYERYSYPTQVIPTIDGMWTSPDEWTDGDATWIGTDIAFRSTWDSSGDDVMTRWIVEFFSDTTDDANDFWRFCIDGQQHGGSEPQLAYHRMFKITGHTNLEWFMGTEQGTWSEVAGAAMEIEWSNSLSASPTNSTPHWILEFQMPKVAGWTIDTVWNFFLGAFDASNSGAGELSWPPTDPNVPDEWGIENYSSENIPEGLTFGVMALLSSVSMLVGYKYFVKRKETKAQ